ncbi:MAG: ribonuclease E/G [Acetobacteraceae bacterium]|nr:ribonuclease E/G [Acetobacteraceae bacterium]
MAEALILAEASPGEVRTALLLGERLMEAWVERPARPDGVGDLHRGRVVAISAAMSGAFVALPGNETGFLPESAASAPRQPIKQSVQEGQILGLRVTRAAQAGKGPRLSAVLTDAEATLIAAAPQGAPRLVARGPCAAQRLAARYPKAVLRVTGAGLVARLRAALGDRVQAQHGAVFDEEIEGDFTALSESAVALPGGGVLHIQTTRALTALDVDSGGAGDGLARFNETALPEIARQIRLRNLSGAILLDVAGLSAKRRQALLEPLRAALAPDRLARLVGLTGLGLFEVVRDRIHPPLAEILHTPLAEGLAALRQAARDAAARPAERLMLEARPDVIAVLRDLPGALDDYTALTGHGLELRSVASGPPQIREVPRD